MLNFHCLKKITCLMNNLISWLSSEYLDKNACFSTIVMMLGIDNDLVMAVSCKICVPGENEIFC